MRSKKSSTNSGISSAVPEFGYGVFPLFLIAIMCGAVMFIMIKLINTRTLLLNGTSGNVSLVPNRFSRLKNADHVPNENRIWPPLNNPIWSRSQCGYVPYLKITHLPPIGNCASTLDRKTRIVPVRIMWICLRLRIVMIKKDRSVPDPQSPNKLIYVNRK